MAAVAAAAAAAVETATTDAECSRSLVRFQLNFVSSASVSPSLPRDVADNPDDLRRRRTSLIGNSRCTVNIKIAFTAGCVGDAPTRGLCRHRRRLGPMLAGAVIGSTRARGGYRRRCRSLRLSIPVWTNAVIGTDVGYCAVISKSVGHCGFLAPAWTTTVVIGASVDHCGHRH